MTGGPRKTPQELADEFYMIAGQCIAQWAITDDALFILCAKILQCAVEHAAIVYYRVSTLDMRLTLTSDLVGSIIPKPKSGEVLHPDLKLWREIEKTCRDLLQIRNRIAHEPVWPAFRMGYDEDFKANRVFLAGFELYANQHERSRGRKDKPPLRIDQLQSHLIAVNPLSGRIHIFGRDVVSAHVAAFASQYPLPIPWSYPLPTPAQPKEPPPLPRSSPR
jgi:hypothetical protein